ncbi:hypothetical protein BMF94_4216 [Rhodotorula taiwanensis]|uniref:Uncharacterized protein n=1 Tax=Rhodotorula taiwanensis TaxID=741276 RepID=A0A2S5B7S0_9BASI|nr:hypothetical protein BMF94_4216 [Rhodotorula taiwanensis]
MASAAAPNDSADEIPPLAFETEEELRAVSGTSATSKGKGKAVLETDHDKKLANDLVVKDFYAKMEAIIVQNCTITGLSWSEYQRKKKRGGKRLLRISAAIGMANLGLRELGKTQPFDDTLHQRVLKYQNDLFDAREINARERVDAPARTAQYVDEIIRLDREHAGQLESARFEVPEEISLAKPRSRKSLGGAGEAPSAAQAQEYYEEGKASLDKLLADVPKLATAAEEARKVALDAGDLR